MRLQNSVTLAFVFCYMWAVAGNLPGKFFDTFDSFVRNQFEDNQDIRVRTVATCF